MKIISIILRNIEPKALHYGLSMAIVFFAIFNVSSVQAESLKNGEIFEFNDGRRYAAIRVVSSNEVELEHKDIGMAGGILLGKYTIDGDRVRIVISGLGTMVQYYKITSDGLVDEKRGTIFYSKAALAAKEKMVKAALTAEKFTFNGDEVIDKSTGLIWRRCVEGMVYRGNTCTKAAKSFNHDKALQHAAAEAKRTRKAWRLPNKDELATIVDLSRIRQGSGMIEIDPTAFPATPRAGYWTSSLSPDKPAAYAWATSFGGAIENAYSSREGDYCVRLVRTGQ